MPNFEKKPQHFEQAKNDKHDKYDRNDNNSHPDKSKVSSIEKIAELSEKLKNMDAEITKLKDELETTKDSALRVRADAENYRKRAEKDAQSLAQYANEGILKDLVPSLDSLTIAINSASDEKVKKGIEIVYDSVFAVMKKYGVEELDVLGKEFDPNTSEAFLFDENSDCEVDMVIEVLQKGYKYNDKILRSAKVKVAKGTKS